MIQIFTIAKYIFPAYVILGISYHLAVKYNYNQTLLFDVSEALLVFYNVTMNLFMLHNLWFYSKFSKTKPQARHPDHPGVLFHYVFLATFHESADTLLETLQILNKSIKNQNVTVILATENHDPNRVKKTDIIRTAIAENKSFKFKFMVTCHTLVKHEQAGKCSNMAHAFNKLCEIIDHDELDHRNKYIHIFDGDSHCCDNYFEEVEKVLTPLSKDDLARSIIGYPTVFRNHEEVPMIVQIADKFWSLLTLTLLFPKTKIITPTSHFAMSLALAKSVDGWEKSILGIADDLHMAMKAICTYPKETLFLCIYKPFSSKHITAEERDLRTNFLGAGLTNFLARFRQACRHALCVFSFYYFFVEILKAPRKALSLQMFMALMIISQTFIQIYYVGTVIFYYEKLVFTVSLTNFVLFLYNIVYQFRVEKAAWGMPVDYKKMLYESVYLLLFGFVTINIFCLLCFVIVMFRHSYSIKYKYF